MAIDKLIYVIAELSGRPTDLAGESLFMTTIMGITFLWGGGMIVEIPHFQELIQSKSYNQRGAKHAGQ
jgi:hypothetical protein